MQGDYCRKVGSSSTILTVYRTKNLFCYERYTIMEVSTVGLHYILYHGILLYVFSRVSMAETYVF